VECVVASWTLKKKYNERLGLDKIVSQKPQSLLRLRFVSHQKACAFKNQGFYELNVPGVDITNIRCGWWLR
jgi:hypothetical protein